MQRVKGNQMTNGPKDQSYSYQNYSNPMTAHHDPYLPSYFMTSYQYGDGSWTNGEHVQQFIAGAYHGQLGYDSTAIDATGVYGGGNFAGYDASGAPYNGYGEYAWGNADLRGDSKQYAGYYQYENLEQGVQNIDLNSQKDGAPTAAADLANNGPTDKINIRANSEGAPVSSSTATQGKGSSKTISWASVASQPAKFQSNRRKERSTLTPLLPSRHSESSSWDNRNGGPKTIVPPPAPKPAWDAPRSGFRSTTSTTYSVPPPPSCSPHQQVPIQQSQPSPNAMLFVPTQQPPMDYAPPLQQMPSKNIQQRQQTPPTSIQQRQQTPPKSAQQTPPKIIQQQTPPKTIQTPPKNIQQEQTPPQYTSQQGSQTYCDQKKIAPPQFAQPSTDQRSPNQTKKEKESSSHQHHAPALREEPAPEKIENYQSNSEEEKRHDDELTRIKLSEYNPQEFDLAPKGARFFVIKSYSEDDIHRSIKYSIWCSTEHGNKRLDAAFTERKGKGPIFLFYSVNGSGHFCGMAQMLSKVDYNSSASVWAQDKWKGQFKVKWIYVKDVQNNILRHIRLENNENKPVTNSRDTQEVPFEHGLEVLRIIHTYEHSTSIFDDFLHYDKRQEETVHTKRGVKHQYGNPNQNFDRDFGGEQKRGGFYQKNYSRGGSFNNQRDPRDFRDQRDFRDIPRNPRDSFDDRDPRDFRDSRDFRGESGRGFYRGGPHRGGPRGGRGGYRGYGFENNRGDRQ